MTFNVPLAHDFICPWCWVAILQVGRLQKEFDIKFDWQGYELLPEEMEWPDFSSTPPPANKPPVLSRFDFILVADNIEMPTVERPKKMRSHNAHEAVEYVKQNGDANPFVEAMYRALWEEGREINDPAVIRDITLPFVKDPDDLVKAIAERRFAVNIVPFDDEAYAKGIYNVPTYEIGGKRYAEQPYAVLRKAFQEMNKN